MEDDSRIANFVAKGLREQAYAVDVAADGEDAIYQASVNAYDLAILDVRIPAPDGEMPIYGDETLVRRLTMNLLDNAIKYTSEGGKINVACQRSGSEYSLTVQDSGPGIPPAAQEKILERFFRLDPARTHNRREPGPVDAAAPTTTGAGLGLAIARWIAEAHHGRLVLVHSDASGSTFAAFLPVNSAASAAETTDAMHPKFDSTS